MCTWEITDIFLNFSAMHTWATSLKMDLNQQMNVSVLTVLHLNLNQTKSRQIIFSFLILIVLFPNASIKMFNHYSQAARAVLSTQEFYSIAKNSLCPSIWIVTVISYQKNYNSQELKLVSTTGFNVCFIPNELRSTDSYLM